MLRRRPVYQTLNRRSPPSLGVGASQDAEQSRPPTQSTSSAMRRALRKRSSDSGSRSPRRRPSDILGIVKRLSQLTTPSRDSPCSGPSGTSVGRPRIVPVTAATVTLARTGIARSRVTMTTGRRPPARSTSLISPRFRAARRPLRDQMPSGRRVPRRQPNPPAGSSHTPGGTPRRSGARAVRAGHAPGPPAVRHSCLQSGLPPRSHLVQPRPLLSDELELELSYNSLYTLTVRHSRPGADFLA